MSNRSNGKNLGKRSDCLEDYWYSPSNYHKYLIFIEKGVILYHIVQVISRKHGKVPLWKCNWRAQSLRNLSLIAPSRSYTPRHLETATRTINHCYHRNVLESQREKCFLLKGKQERRGGGVGGGWRRRRRVDVVATLLVTGGQSSNPPYPCAVHCTHFRLSLKPAISAQPFQTRRPLERNYATRASQRPAICSRIK